MLVKQTKKFKYQFNVSITNMDNLIKNIKKLLNSAKLVYNTMDYTSATILYFKCLFMIIDYIILKKNGKTPKDHGERFRILEKDFPDLYIMLDKDFPLYRNTYSLSISKEKCNGIKENVRKTIEEYKIPIND